MKYSTNDNALCQYTYQPCSGKGGLMDLHDTLHQARQHISSEFFVGVSLGKTLQSPSLLPVKPRKDMDNVSFRHDITKIPLKAA